MLLKCIIGSFSHLLFFGLIVISLPVAVVIYVLIKPFLNEPEYFFQKGFALSNRIFFFLVPKIKLQFDLQKDLPESAIYLSTHQSILDYPILSLLIKKHLIVAKVNLGAVPFVAFISNLVGVRYFAGKSIDEVSKIYQEFEDMLVNNNNIIFFPEGTRHTGKDLEPFKRGAFRLSVKTEKPIVPVVIEGLTQILPRKSFCFRTNKKTVVHVKMLKPVYPQEFDSDIALMKYIQKIMQEQKDTLCDLS
ncbi:1-acyl-sn-glycerol-3-phosphate acyltransferase [hydrothermal vent metagenome]|uniref:1-acyl-sn-glycerol-3-phosphate acyltransferase n=1 Tax=hydrothermal vent metagenome TaxID=652676 RepID=A0A1W1C6W3_9ZZZZ